MKKLINSITLLSIFSLLCCMMSYAQQINNSGQRGNMVQSNNQYWTIEYAIKLAKESAHVSYGIKDMAKFNQIVAQKDKGDPNALFAYAYLLRFYYGVSDHVKLSHEQGRDEAFKIWWVLSEKNHPQACDELIKIGNQYTFTQINITAPNLLEKQLRCVDVALQHNLKSYSRYADLLFFELKKDEVHKLLLTDSQKLNNDELTKKAVQLYERCARETGARYCLARTTEAYYQGIGVEKNKTFATAWAKLTTQRAIADDPFKTIRYAHKIYKELVLDFTTQETDAFKAYFETLNKIPKV